MILYVKSQDLFHIVETGIHYFSLSIFSDCHRISPSSYQQNLIAPSEWRYEQINAEHIHLFLQN